MENETFSGMWYFSEDEQKGKAMFPGLETVFDIEVVKDDEGELELRLSDTDEYADIFCFSRMEEKGN